MALSSLPRGLIIDLYTPILDGGIDYQVLRPLLARIKNNTLALLVCSPKMGRGLVLSPEARMELILFVQEHLPKDVILMPYVSLGTKEGTIDFISRVQEALMDGSRTCLVDSPLLYHSNSGLLDLYQEYGRFTTLPFCLYNDPYLISTLRKPFKRSNIRTKILKSLSLANNILGLIFYGEMGRLRNYHRAVRGNPNFTIYEGDEQRFLESPGNYGVVSGLANLEPERWQYLVYQCVSAPRIPDESPEHQNYLLKVLKELKEMGPVNDLKYTLAFVEARLSNLQG